MTSKKCGSENDDHGKIIQEFGANLDQAPKPSAKKPRTYLIAALVAVGAIAVITLVLLLGNGRSLTGPWHNEGLGQLLRFREDETVVIRTPHGDFEAAYVFDQEDGRGVIIFNEEAISFTIEGEELLLTWSGVQTAFVRGEMEVAAIAEATPGVTASTATTPPLEVTPEASTSASLPSTAIPTTPSAAPTTAPSVAPSASPTPTALPSSLGPLFTPLPQITVKPVIPGDIIGNLTIPIVGDWIHTDNPEFIFTFYDNGGYVVSVSGSERSGDYTYDKATGKGELEWINGTRHGFTVSGNTLRIEDGPTFKRK